MEENRFLLPDDSVMMLFRTGYVIELEAGHYFSGRKKGCICKAALEEAKYFQTLRMAERFVRRHLGYAGFQVRLCRVCWTLVETESLETEWRFLPDKHGGAVKFDSYQEAENYRREKGLQNFTMAELYAFREKELLAA